MKRERGGSERVSEFRTSSAMMMMIYNRGKNDN